KDLAIVDLEDSWLSNQPRRRGCLSKWAADLMQIDELAMANQKWLAEGIRKMVGNGVTTEFWYENWTKDMELKSKFP
ncbi:hypothetical protein Ancab_001384, partial [Ancistrocladus abbreviatus]